MTEPTPAPAAVVFLDTETVGLHPIRDQIWEVAAIRREPDGTETSLVMLVEHERPGGEYLSSKFADDYKRRYDHDRAVTRQVAVDELRRLCHDRPHLVGAVPSFDTERLGHMRRFINRDAADPWHYHIIDVETLVVGWLRGQTTARNAVRRMEWLTVMDEPFPGPPWDSNALSLAAGVDPAQFERHTAMGDVRWAQALYDRVMGGAV